MSQGGVPHTHLESQLDRVIAEYLEEVEAGHAPDRAALLELHPELADMLAKFLDDLDRVGRVLRPPSGVGRFDPPIVPLTCPHCHGLLATAEETAACPGCGAKFRLDDGQGLLREKTRLGRFELIAVAGHGAFGTVYKGWDPAMRRDVAVKIPRRGTFATKEEIARFFREARFATTLHHPGIVRIYETGQDDGIAYEVSEFVQGCTLADLLKKSRPDPILAARLIASVAEALHYAHEKGVVHRDVKPSNIMLRDGRVPVLADFGLARRDGGELTLTLSGQPLGTLAYMSPEQARGDAHRVDRRSDVYGLGAVFYEMLTSYLLFDGNPTMMLRQILDDSPRPPRRLNDRLPRDLETICLKCLRKEPNHRYPTAAELAGDLGRFLERRPISARPPGPLERLGLWARRNPWLAAANGLAAAFLVATTAVSVAWAIDAGRKASKIRLALNASERLRAEGYLDRGLGEAEQGNIGAGLLWMARSLETLPAGADGPEWIARANLGSWRRELLALADCSAAPQGEVLGFRADGRVAWVVDPDGRTIRAWDTASRDFQGPLLRHPDRVTALGVSPDGSIIATSCQGRGLPVQLWDARDGKMLRSIHVEGQAYAAAFSSDGRTIVTGSVERKSDEVSTTFRGWDVQTGRPDGHVFRQSGWVVAMALGPDSRSLYCVTQPGTLIHRWVLAGGWSQNIDLPHPVPIKALAISPDGRYILVAGGRDRLARLCDSGSGRVVAALHHRTPASAVAFGRGGRVLLTASPGDALRSWERMQLPAPPAAPHGGKIRAVAISPDGRKVATGADDRVVRLWELAGGELVQVGALPEFDSPIASLAFSPDGRLLATCTHQHPGATLWDVTTRKLRTFLDHSDRVSKLVFSPDGDRVATAGYQGEARLWGTRDGRTITTPSGFPGAVSTLAFSPDGKLLATGGEDGQIRLWEAAKGGLVGDPLPLCPGTPVKVVVFSPRGDTILAAGEDGLARLWDTAVGRAIGPPLGHGFRVWTGCFSPDGRTVLTGGWDSTARLWRVDTGAGIGPPLQHAGRVSVTAFGPANRWAVTASEDGTVRYWDVETGRALGPPLRHDGQIRCAVIEPGGKWIVTAGFDRTARVWPAPAAIEGPASELSLWAEVVAGVELDGSGGMRALDSSEWVARRSRLQQPGGATRD